LFIASGNGDPFLTPIHERLLDDAQKLKSNLSIIKEDVTYIGGTMDEKGDRTF